MADRIPFFVIVVGRLLQAVDPRAAVEAIVQEIRSAPRGQTVDWRVVMPAGAEFAGMVTLEGDDLEGDADWLRDWAATLASGLDAAEADRAAADPDGS